MSETMPSERLEAFRSEVAEVRIGGANPAKWERAGAILGPLLALVGLVLAVVAYSTAQDATNFETIHRQQVFSAVAVCVTLIGAVLWLRVSITRHQRWWMIRQIHEQRAQTDRIIAALTNQDQVRR
jgi:uncharacterized membrane protein